MEMRDTLDIDYVCETLELMGFMQVDNYNQEPKFYDLPYIFTNAKGMVVIGKAALRRFATLDCYCNIINPETQEIEPFKFSQLEVDSMCSSDKFFEMITDIENHAVLGPIDFEEILNLQVKPKGRMK